MKPSVVASAQALPRPTVEEWFSPHPCYACPAASAWSGRSPAARFRLSPAGNLAKRRAGCPAAPPPLLACSPPRQRMLWDRPSLSDRVRFPAGVAKAVAAALATALGRPVELVVRVSLACSSGSVSPGCNHSWLSIPGAGTHGLAVEVVKMQFSHALYV